MPGQYQTRSIDNCVHVHEGSQLRTDSPSSLVEFYEPKVIAKSESNYAAVYSCSCECECRASTVGPVSAMLDEVFFTLAEIKCTRRPTATARFPEGRKSKSDTRLGRASTVMTAGAAVGYCVLKRCTTAPCVEDGEHTANCAGSTGDHLKPSKDAVRLSACCNCSRT